MGALEFRGPQMMVRRPLVDLSLPLVGLSRRGLAFLHRLHDRLAGPFPRLTGPFMRSLLTLPGVTLDLALLHPSE